MVAERDGSFAVPLLLTRHQRQDGMPVASGGLIWV